MAYQQPIHGKWCGARTYPMTCRYCGTKIFYFSCEHGSKVFFEELGQPWPLHYCPNLPQETFSTTPPDDSYNPTIIAANMMRPKREHPSLNVEPGFIVKMREHLDLDRKNRRGEVDMEPPPKKSHEDLGHIKDFAERVDIFQQLKIDKNNAMAHAFLGELAEQEIARIVLVVDDPEQDDLERYSCYIPTKLLKSAGVIRGDVVNFKIKPISVPGKGVYWLCVQLESPFTW